MVIVDRAVDQKTGTLNFAAEFPNPDGRLRPGQFGRVRAVVETAKDAILIPKRAVQEIQGMQTVLVVGADNMVALRTIQPGETVGDLLIVRDGLKPGERVIVDGIQKARPGSQGQSDEAADGGPAGAKPAQRAGPARRVATRRRGEIVHGRFLHPSADRRDRHRDPDRDARRGHDRRACRSSSIRSWRRRTSA